MLESMVLLSKLFVSAAHDNTVSHVPNAIKGDIPEHFDPCRYTLLKSSHGCTTRSGYLPRLLNDQERNGAGGLPTSGLKAVGLPMPSELEKPMPESFFFRLA